MNNKNFPEFQGLRTPLVYREGGIDLVDQTQLPLREVVLRITNYLDMADAIRQMKVRGAPAIGIAAAYGIVLGMQEQTEGRDLAVRFAQVTLELRRTRPTAVNLFWAIERLEQVFQEHKNDESIELRKALLAEARTIHKEDIEAITGWEATVLISSPRTRVSLRSVMLAPWLLGAMGQRWE